MSQHSGTAIKATRTRRHRLPLLAAAATSLAGNLGGWWLVLDNDGESWGLELALLGMCVAAGILGTSSASPAVRAAGRGIVVGALASPLVIMVLWLVAMSQATS